MPDTDVKISELEAASSANADDRLEASQVDGVGFASRSITLQQVSDLVAADLPPPVTDWDDITGKPATFPPTTPIPYTDISGTPTALPPNGAAGGDLSGSYPNPLLKPSVTNGQIMTTVGGVSTWAAAPASATLPAASVGYGDAGNTLTGVLANMSFIAADRKFGVGVAAPTASIHAVSTTNNQPVFKATGIASSSAAQNWFHVAVVDPTGGSGSSFRIDGGASGALALYDIDRSGDALVSGWQRILSQTALAAGGRYYMGLYIGNGSGGNTGLYAGTGAPTLDTFGTFGSIYMDASTPGIPYYNSNGSTGWTRLAPITHVGTTAPSPAIDNQLWYNSDAAVGGGQLYVRYNDGSSTAWVPASPAASGGVVQTVSTQTGAMATGTTIIPVDDTIPQITEGDQYMSLAITPRSATSKLIIDVVAHLTNSSAAAPVLTAALFQDSTVNALALGFMSIPAGFVGEIKFTHSMISGTTSATTFRVRGGGHAAGTTTFNGNASARLFGGAIASSIVIQEVL